MAELDDPAVVAAFSESWDEVQAYYQRLVVLPGWERLAPMLELISSLRSDGWDRRLRGGTSVWQLVLSRSREHGLRPEQPALTLFPQRESGRLVLIPSFGRAFCGGPVESATIALSAGLLRLLEELAAFPID